MTSILNSHQAQSAASGKVKPTALLCLIILSACATPASPAAPVYDDVLAGMVANATQTAVSVAADKTRTADVMAIENAAATENARLANEVATAAAVSTADHAMNAVVIDAAVAVEQAELHALQARLANETWATAEAMNIDMKNKSANQERGAWVWDGLAGVVLFVIGYVGIGGGRLLHRNASTVRDKDGNPYIYKDDYLYDNSPSAPLLIEQPARQVPFSPHRGDARVIDYRQGLALTRVDGGRAIVYRFTGQNLDALEMNVLTGDFGFRRNSSGNGQGLDDLIGLSNGNLYSAIVTAMMGRGWLELVGDKNRWTDSGVVDMLEMSSLPHSPNGAG